MAEKKQLTSEKYPDLWQVFQSLCEEEKRIEEASAAYRQKRDELLEVVAPIQDEIRKLSALINEIERPRIVEVRNQKASLARAMGGRVMSNPPAAAEEETQ